MSSPYHTSYAVKMTADSSILSRNADGQNRNKKFFLGGKTIDMQEKKLKTLLCMV